LKILIVKLHALGDLVIASPAIRILRDNIPEAELDLLTTAWTEPAMENNPVFSNIITVQNEVFFKPGISTVYETIKLINAIKRNRYDAAILFHVNKGIDYFLRPTGIGKRIMFAPSNDSGDVYLDPSRHSALTACELANFAIHKLTKKTIPTAELNSLSYEWFISDEETAKALSILESVNIYPGKFMAIFPGGGVNPGVVDKVRRWKSSGFADVARYAKDSLKLTPLLMGGKSDRQVCEDVTRQSSVDCVNLAGAYNMRISAAILGLCRIAVTNDSGPLHIAAAVGVPVVGVFGPTGPELKLPPGEHVYSASTGLPCSPCYFGKFQGCIFDKIKCFEELTVENVLSVVKRAMDKPISSVN